MSDETRFEELCRERECIWDNMLDALATEYEEAGDDHARDNDELLHERLVELCEQRKKESQDDPESFTFSGELGDLWWKYQEIGDQILRVQADGGEGHERH